MHFLYVLPNPIMDAQEFASKMSKLSLVNQENWIRLEVECIFELNSDVSTKLQAISSNFKWYELKPASSNKHELLACVHFSIQNNL